LSIAMSTGMMAAKEQSKAAKKEKELAACAKKEAIRDKQWKVGAKNTSKQDEAATKSDEKAKAKAEKDALLAKEGGVVGGGKTMKKCKECKQMRGAPRLLFQSSVGRRDVRRYNINSKKGCENCVALLFGGAAPGAKKKKK